MKQVDEGYLMDVNFIGDFSRLKDTIFGKVEGLVNELFFIFADKVIFTKKSVEN